MASKSRRGRPSAPDAIRRRRMIGLRIREETRAILERDAARSGRSLSQEVEHRIEQTYERRELLREVLEARFGSHIAGYVLLFGLAMRDTATYVSGARTFDQDDQVQRRVGGHWNLTDTVVRKKAL